VWPSPEILTDKKNTVQGIEQKKSQIVRSSPFSDDSTKITLASSVSYDLPGITTSMDHYLSLYLRERFLLRVLRANAHPGFRDWHHLIRVGTEATTTMSAFLATAAMHALWTNPRFKLAAVRYYNSAIKGLRKVIADGIVEGIEN
jgi:hypothetical protein